MFDPLLGKIPWRREWLPTLVFLPGEFHGQRSPVGYHSRGHKELDMTEQLALTSLLIKRLLIKTAKLVTSNFKNHTSN